MYGVHFSDEIATAVDIAFHSDCPFYPVPAHGSCATAVVSFLCHETRVLGDTIKGTAYYIRTISTAVTERIAVSF